jgi:hypothetical protein
LSALILLLLSTAQAAEPVLRVDGERVVVDVTVQAPLSTVLPILQTPTEIARIDGGGTEITLIKEGPCDELQFGVPSFIGKIEYVVSFCKDATGSTANLLRSEDMASYQAIWQATDTGAGVHIHYEILALPAMKVPRRLSLGATKRQVKKLFEKIVVEVEGG